MCAMESILSPTETNDIECTILNEDSPKIEKQPEKNYTSTQRTPKKFKSMQMENLKNQQIKKLKYFGSECYSLEICY